MRLRIRSLLPPAPPSAEFAPPDLLLPSLLLSLLPLMSAGGLALALLVAASSFAVGAAFTTTRLALPSLLSLELVLDTSSPESFLAGFFAALIGTGLLLLLVLVLLAGVPAGADVGEGPPTGFRGSSLDDALRRVWVRYVWLVVLLLVSDLDIDCGLGYTGRRNDEKQAGSRNVRAGENDRWLVSTAAAAAAAFGIALVLVDTHQGGCCHGIEVHRGLGIHLRGVFLDPSFKNPVQCGGFEDLVLHREPCDIFGLAQVARPDLETRPVLVELLVVFGNADAGSVHAKHFWGQVSG